MGKLMLPGRTCAAIMIRLHLQLSTKGCYYFLLYSIRKPSPSSNDRLYGIDCEYERSTGNSFFPSKANYRHKRNFHALRIKLKNDQRCSNKSRIIFAFRSKLFSTSKPQFPF